MSNRGMENEFVQALSTEDGKPIWTTRLGNVGNLDQDPPFPKARSTPTVDGDFIYALASDGDLACLEAKSGKVRWQKNLRKEFGGQHHEWAYAESPLVDGVDLVFRNALWRIFSPGCIPDFPCLPENLSRLKIPSNSTDSPAT